MSSALGLRLKNAANFSIEIGPPSLKEFGELTSEVLMKFPFVISVNKALVPHLTFRFRVENGARTGEIEIAAKDKLLGWFGLTEDCALAVDGRPVSLQRLKLMLSSLR
jgi:hypothetical protein